MENLLSESYVTVETRKDNKREKLVKITEEGKAYCEKVVCHITWAEDEEMADMIITE